IVYDVNPGEAAAERQKTFSAFADARQLVAAPHLPFPGVGHIRAEGGGSFTWHPAEYRNREESQGQ
ncbi:MBL fold metallo-hydrolase, partial [Mesorhizobium sp. M6A.T.Ca.TU.002.02.2.1]